MAHSGHDAEPVEGSAGSASLVFRAGGLLCALGLDDVVETMRPLDTRPLAGSPPWVRGISIMRGVPAPVIDVARLLTGASADVARYVAVRTERGPVALATGPVLGIRTAAATAAAASSHTALLTGAGAAARLVAGIGMIDAEPLLLLQSMRVVPDEIWAAAAGEAVPS